MDTKMKKKLIIWILSSIILVIAFFIGLNMSIGTILVVIIPVLIIIDYFSLNILKNERDDTSIGNKKILIWIYLSFNLLFAFIMGLLIPSMESKVRYNMGYVMIPLLLILNYIIVDRFHFYLKIANHEELFTQSNRNKEMIKGKPVIEFGEDKYIFTPRSIIIALIGAPILSYAIYYFFDTQGNYWLHEIVVKQTVFFLNLLFNMGAEAEYEPVGFYHWRFSIPEKGSIYFQTFCTGVQAICVFAGIIVFIPHSLDQKTNKDIIWRKTKALIMSSVIFYVVNIIRMVIQLYLYSIGYRWEDIHYSISAASSFIAAIIILLLHKWIPEFIISIIYAGSLVDKKIKDNRNETIIEMVEESNEVPLILMRKVLRMDKQTYMTDMIPWAEKYGYSTKGDVLIIPKEGVEKFIKMLAWEKPFEKETVNE